MKKTLIGLILILALITGAALFGTLPALSAGDDVVRHVSPQGSDEYGDGTETWVDADGSEDWTEGDTGPFATIQKGIDEVPENGIVYVAAGDFVENLSISKSLTIQGAGIDITNVISDGDWSSAFFINDTYDVIIDGFTITGVDCAIYIVETLEDCSITISNCRICNTPGAGIYVPKVGAGASLTIENNIIENNPGSGIYIEYITNGGTVNIQNNTQISDNYFGVKIDVLGFDYSIGFDDEETDLDALIDYFLAEGAAYLNITGNTINGNTIGNGIRINDQNFPSYLTVRGNTIEGNDYPGISLDGGWIDWEFYENHDNEAVSIKPGYSDTFSGASVVIDDNVIRNNSGAGISLYELSWSFGANVTIENNTISGSDAGIFHGFCNDNDATFIVRDNTIVNNSVYGGIYWAEFEGTISTSYSSSYAISNNIIAGNAADADAGYTTAGIHTGIIDNSSLLIQGNTIGPYDGPGDDDNYGPNEGDAVYIPSMSPESSVIVKENKIEISSEYKVLNCPGGGWDIVPPIMAVHNWWGDGIDYTALAEACSGDYVILSPWYSSSLMRPEDLVHAAELAVHNQTQDIDFDLIQQVIMAANSGDIITAGVTEWETPWYEFCDNIDIDKSLTLRAVPGDVEPIIWAYDEDQPVITIRNNIDVTIEGFTIEDGSHGIFMPDGNNSGSTVIIRNCNIISNYEDGIHIGCTVENGSYTIEDNFIAENYGIGINTYSFDSDSTLMIQDNTIGEGVITYTEDGESQDEPYQGNYHGGIYIGTSSDGRVSIRGNKIAGNSGYAVENSNDNTLDAVYNWWGTPDYADISELLAGDVNYDPWYTNAAMTTMHSGHPVYNTNDPDFFYDSIQAAINTAESGDTINVAAGTYHEGIYIDTSLTLQGAGADSTLVTAEGMMVYGTVYIASGIDVTVEGLAFAPEYAGLIEDISEGNTVTIKDCLFTGSNHGLYVHGNISGTLEISGTAFAGSESFGLNIGQIHDGGAAYIHDNTFTGCGEGINLEEAAAGGTLEIEYNTFTGNAAGVYIENTGALTFPGMTFQYNRLSGNTLAVDCKDPSTIGGPINMESNWWGSPDGPPAAGDNAVPAYIDADPWHLKQLTGVTLESTTKKSIALSWTTAVIWSGDHYDFRYSTSPITDNASWNNAKRVTDEPITKTGSQCMNIRGLNPGTTYYFALTITDGATSSNRASFNADTEAAEVANNTEPGSITDLTAVTAVPSTSTIRLTWTATGDDGDTGFASKYIIKRSAALITEDNVNDAATVFTVYNDLKPKASGEPESFTITKLTPGTDYFFAIIAVDEAGNTSALGAGSVTDTACATAANQPEVTGITADVSGTDNNAARVITITGANLQPGSGATSVRLVKGNDTINLTGVTVDSNVQIRATVPIGTPAGEYAVRVTNANGTSLLSAAKYTVTATLLIPEVTNVLPNLAAGNTAMAGIQIYGKNFTGATAVFFGDTAADSFTVNSDSKITANAPGLAVGAYEVKVTAGGLTNDISAVKYIVTAKVEVTADTTEDKTTSDVVNLTTNLIPVKLTLTTDNSTGAGKNTDNDAEITVIISDNTTVTSNNEPYTGVINPPRVIKPQTDLPESATVIEMGNPSQTIWFDQDFVAVITVSSDTTPVIYYYDKSSLEYELAGKTGTLDGIAYVPGGVLLNTESISDTKNVYTIGLLLDHMSTYVASNTNLVPPEEPEEPVTPNGSYGGGLPQVPGITNIKLSIMSNGRFFEYVLATTEDNRCAISIPVDTIGLDKDGKALTVITMLPADALEPLPENYTVIGMAYDFGPSGATFAPAVTLTWKYIPEELPDNIDVSMLKIAYYDTPTGAWIFLETSIDTEHNTLTAGITHFSTFAVVAQITTEPEPTAPSTPEPAISEKTPVTEPEPTSAVKPDQTPEPIPEETQKPGPDIAPEETTEPVTVPSDNKVDWPLLMVIFSSLILVVLAAGIYLKYKKR